MTWKITTEEVAPPVPDGEYAAMAVAIQEIEGKHGPMVKIDFQIDSEDQWDGRQVADSLKSLATVYDSIRDARGHLRERKDRDLIGCLN